jgi:glycine betaine/proline transport system ATP-binding protein
MDEPFSGLDPLLRAQMQRELLGIQDRLGTTVLFITHDAREAFALGSKVALMRAGSIVQQGTPHELNNEPADEFVRRFIST